MGWVERYLVVKPSSQPYVFLTYLVLSEKIHYLARGLYNKSLGLQLTQTWEDTEIGRLLSRRYTC